MTVKRFQKTRIVDKWGGIYDSKNDEVLNVNDVEHKLNEQQATINLLLEELVNAQQQGYVIGFLHKNEHCNLILKELDE